MNDLLIIFLALIVSIPCAILGSQIGLWLADNFSIRKLIKKKKNKIKYLA